MAGVNNHNIPEHMAENNLQPDYAPFHPLDGQLISVIGESQEQQSMDHEPYVLEEPQVMAAAPPVVTGITPLPQGAPMQDIMAALVNAINFQSDLILQQNQRFELQSRRIDAIAESRVTRHPRSHRARRSPTRKHLKTPRTAKTDERDTLRGDDPLEGPLPLDISDDILPSRKEVTKGPYLEELGSSHCPFFGSHLMAINVVKGLGPSLWTLYILHSSMESGTYLI
ncbi:hypothetical protein L195_g039518 [Trifolium pratense]|uniref:Uncharacterized protein n=1 Tax=Trifolium pratense TaxID=57577 RepID=A0A2K3LY60_TRIPR|nr:hypothetical protein L195_g039518 [Trifolium pratense]